MEHWGRKIDGEWEQGVLNRMLVSLRNGEKWTRKDLFCDLILMGVERHLWLAFNDFHLVTTAIESFQTHFDRICNVEFKDFYSPSKKSLEFAKMTVELNYRTPSADPVPVPASPVVIESSPAIVESSPDVIQSDSRMTKGK